MPVTGLIYLYYKSLMGTVSSSFLFLKMCYLMMASVTEDYIRSMIDECVWSVDGMIQTGEVKHFE